MKFFERITQRLGTNTRTIASPAVLSQDALNRAKIYKRAELYPEALAELDRAVVSLRPQVDAAILTAIDLHRAEIFIARGQWEDAHALLEKLQEKTTADGQPAPLAYTLVTLGVLAQAQGDWNIARNYYEQALNPARASGSLGAEARAQGYLADTYLQEGSADYAVRLLEEAIPKLELSGDTEPASYFVGRLGQARIALGQSDQGQQLLERALSLAKYTHHLRYIVLWRRVLAIRAIISGAYAEAKNQLTSVVAQPGLDATKPEFVPLFIWLSKVSLRLGETAAGLDYARQAVELAAKSGAANDIFRAQAALGIALRAAGNPTEALPLLTTIAPSYEHLHLDEADYTYIDLLRNLADAQIAAGDDSAASATYACALSAAESHNMPSEVAHILRDQGALLFRQEQFEETIAAWNKAIPLYAAQNDLARATRLRCDIANTRKYLGQGTRAMRDLTEALTLLNRVDDRQTRGLVLANAAIAYTDHGDRETAAAFFVEALEIAQSLDDRIAEATRRGNYGWFLLATGQSTRALETLQMALQQSEILGLKLQAAIQTGNIGLVYDSLEQRTQALDHHQRALILLGEVDSPHWTASANVNLGQTLLALGRLAEAEALLATAAQVGRATQSAELLLRAWNGQIELALEQSRNDAAGALIDEAMPFARRTENRRLLAETLRLRSRYHAQIGQRELAVADWEEAVKLQKMLRPDRADPTPAWLA